ncbi:MAG: hypothetical protein G01um101430_212 [Parcubacteria group bacterium Gr01-1014_30]|nr:MAG: hypothetical protein G01um101430_212 [Parcubacteria group bacterium Gr01-1014_30]
MQDNVKNIIGLSLAASSLVFAFSMFILASAFLDAKEPARTFTVSAEGEVIAIPDIAEFTYAVITEVVDDLPVLQEENSAKSNRVNSFLKEKGVSQEDIKTVGYNISPRYQFFPCPSDARICPPSEIVGYTVAHSVGVKVRDLTLVGELLSGVVASGANSASGLNFTIDDLEAVQSQARSLAIQNAKKKAAEIADSSGVRLGKIVSINESFFTPFAARELSTDLPFGGALPAEPPAIEPGSQEIKVSVVIKYEIK